MALVEDLCPQYAYDLERGMILNTNMFALKNILRELSPQWYQVHTTQTQQESDADYKFLFGGTARRSSDLFSWINSGLLPSTVNPVSTTAFTSYHGGVYSSPWMRWRHLEL